MAASDDHSSALLTANREEPCHLSFLVGKGEPMTDGERNLNSYSVKMGDVLKYSLGDKLTPGPKDDPGWGSAE